MHPNILTSPDGNNENECSWLWKSPQTNDHDILSTGSGSWEAWTGEVVPLAFVSLTCNECSGESDCSFHGKCGENARCDCEGGYFGGSCEFEVSCPSLATEKAQVFDFENGKIQWEQKNPIRDTGFRVYNRPVSH